MDLGVKIANRKYVNIAAAGNAAADLPPDKARRGDPTGVSASRYHVAASAGQIAAERDRVPSRVPV